MNAYNKRNTALRELRFQRKLSAYAAVLKTDEELVQEIAAKRRDTPNPQQNFTYQQIAYTLQSYENGVARYVPVEVFDPDAYIYSPLDKVERVRAELSVAKQIELELLILRELLPTDVGIPLL